MLLAAMLLTTVAVVAAGWRRRRLALVAQATHELRGPLQSALLAVHGLGRVAGEGVAERVAAIDLELRRAALAVEDLSAAARGGRAGERVAEVDLGALLQAAAPAWEVLARDAGVELRVELPGLPVSVRADRLRVAQALANLVANAVEHGGGAVCVRLRPPGAGPVRVEVTDGGAGLPAPIADLVSAARGRCGSRGHGLALVAGIAARSGGRLTSAPSPRGARLVLELPRAGGPLAGGARRRSLRLGRAGGRGAVASPAGRLP